VRDKNVELPVYPRHYAQTIAGGDRARDQGSASRRAATMKVDRWNSSRASSLAAGKLA